MESSENFLVRAREQAELNCDFVFVKMKDYREITEAELPMGEFSPDELKKYEKNAAVTQPVLMRV